MTSNRLPKIFFSWKSLPFILALLMIAAIPRLWSLFDRGVYYHDEAFFYNNSRFYGTLLRSTALSVMTSNLQLEDLDDQARSCLEDGGNPWLHARPFHEVSLILAYAFFGSVEKIGPLISAVAGILTIIILATGFEVGDYGYAGYVAAFFLALSVWHVHYSRSGLSQAISLLMVCAAMGALLSYLAAQHRSSSRLVLVGVLAGLAFTTHYNLFWLPPLVWVWLAWIEWQGSSRWKAWLKKLAVCAVAMLTPLLFFETLYQSILPALRRMIGEGRWDLMGYLEQILFQSTFTSGMTTPGSNFMFFLKFLTRIESLPYLIVIVSGLFYLVYRSIQKNRIALLLLSWALVPWATWTLFGFPVPRSFLPLLPPLLLGAGWFFESLWFKFNQNRRSRWLVRGGLCVCLGLLIFEQSVRIIPVVQASSPWKIMTEQIAAYQSEHGKKWIRQSELTGYNTPIIVYYLKRAVTSDHANNLFIMDASSYMSGIYIEKRTELAQRCQPIISIEGDLEQGMILEDAFPDSFLSKYRNNQIPHRLEVFDVRECRSN
jgi:hypothetical protein